MSQHKMSLDSRMIETPALSLDGFEAGLAPKRQPPLAAAAALYPGLFAIG